MSHDTNNFRDHGFSRIPDEEEDFMKWTIKALREFLSVSAATILCDCSTEPHLLAQRSAQQAAQQALHHTRCWYMVVVPNGSR